MFHQYTIRVSPDVPEGRDGLAAHLKSAGIPHAVYYPTALHQLPVFKDGHAACRTGDMTHTETAAREVISLPMHTELTGAQQGRVVDAIAEFVQTDQGAGA